MCKHAVNFTLSHLYSGHVDASCVGGENVPVARAIRRETGFVVVSGATTNVRRMCYIKTLGENGLGGVQAMHEAQYTRLQQKGREGVSQDSQSNFIGQHFDCQQLLNSAGTVVEAEGIGELEETAQAGGGGRGVGGL